MDNNNKNKKPIIILLFLVFIIIAGLVGYFIGTMLPSTELNRYKKVVDEFFPPTPDEVFAISGTIKTINDNIVLETASLEERILPGEESKIEERVVLLNSETKIVKWDPFLILEETSPESEEIPILLSELKIGDSISVEASENIKTKKEFTATKIILIEELEN